MRSIIERLDVRIALIYALFGGLWILLSDMMLAALITSAARLTTMQTYKGWFFVLSSSLLIFLLLRRELRLRRITEGKFDESEARYHQVFQNSMDAILLTAPDGSIHAANPAACRMFGRTESEIRQGGRSAVVDMKDTRLISALEERASKGSFHGELTFLRQDGSHFPGEISTNIFKSMNGTDLTSMIIRDITERKNAESELRHSHDQLAELSRRLSETREAESRSIGRELHDQIGQMLTALQLTLDMIPQLPAEAAIKKMTVAQNLVGELLERVSKMTLELRPPMLDDLGLIPTLLWHVNRYHDQTGIAVDFRHGGNDTKRFAPEIESTAYRVIQEALTNIARHAKASSARLQVFVQNEALQIFIEDHGQGFDVLNTLAETPSSGLRGMRERIGLMNGKFEIESKANEGTLITIEIPLQEKV